MDDFAINIFQLVQDLEKQLINEQDLIKIEVIARQSFDLIYILLDEYDKLNDQLIDKENEYKIDVNELNRILKQSEQRIEDQNKTINEQLELINYQENQVNTYEVQEQVSQNQIDQLNMNISDQMIQFSQEEIKQQVITNKLEKVLHDQIQQNQRLQQQIMKQEETIKIQQGELKLLNIELLEYKLEIKKQDSRESPIKAQTATNISDQRKRIEQKYSNKQITQFQQELGLKQILLSRKTSFITEFQNLKSQDDHNPYYEFFLLISQCVKLDLDNHECYDAKINHLFSDCIKIPFHHWYKIIKKYIITTTNINLNNSNQITQY